MKTLIFLSLLLSFVCSAETKLIILGSGTPNPNPERSGSAYAVIVDETAYLIDFGPGVIRSSAALSKEWGGPFYSLNIANLEYAFLTHIHSDHSAGLADLILSPWVLGRDKELKLYGPKGLKDMANSTLEAYKEDIDYRINSSQPSNDVGYKITFKQLFEGVVFRNEHLIVEAFLVNHGELSDSFGFRFQTKDKTIVFSGDTTPTKNIEKFAYKADILVHEVYSQEGFLKKTKEWQVYHKSHHTSTIEVAELARKATPKKLILSHILFWGSTREKILKEVKDNYDGDVLIAEDLMVID